jgi:hypothetical protein
MPGAARRGHAPAGWATRYLPPAPVAPPGESSKYRCPGGRVTPGAPPRAPLPSILAYKYDSHHARLLPLSSAYRRHSGYNATTTAIHTR